MYFFLIIIVVTIISLRVYNYRYAINIYVANSFENYYSIPLNPLKCLYKNVEYVCYYSNRNDLFYKAFIYNGNKHILEVKNSTYNIIMTTEKLSQVMFMKSVGEGKSKNFKLAVDYRSFNNKWHLSVPRIQNSSKLLYISQNNFVNINQFMKRNDNMIYIQSAHYKNRQYIVKQIMKYYKVDSYGRDLNNKEWPYNITRSSKLKLLKQYKFCLAIENSIITWKEGEKYEASTINNDYITEKLIDCFLSGSIPVYFGPKNINYYLPNPESIINMNRFSSIKNLATYLQNIKENITALQKHIIWHYNYSKIWFNRFSSTFSFCNICNYVMKYS